MHSRTDGKLAGPADDPAAPDCGCPCSCSEPAPADATADGENLLAKTQSASYLNDYLIIHGTGAPSQ